MNSNAMNNAELIVRMLERAGVKWAFGVPSGPVLPLIEALRPSSVEFVLTTSETSAGFMAQAVGAMTGVPGVCISTVGPGATNLATGVGAAWLDRSPVIAITCNVPTNMLERRVQMRIDHHALFAPITKATFPLRPHNVGNQVDRALQFAVEEPPGPVHLDLPQDVALTASVISPTVPSVYTGLPAVNEEVFDRVKTLLAASKCPILVGGMELSRVREPHRLVEFIENQGLPFVLTLHAKGFLPESHPNYAGVIGRARRSDVQSFVAAADLIVAVGYDPVELNYEEWTGDIPVVHIGTQPAEASPDFHLALNAAGDLDGAIAALNGLEASENDWTRDEIDEHRARLDAALRPEGSGFGPQHVLDALKTRLPSDAILAYDVGAHTHQIASQWRTDGPWTCISTNGWSSMGYGIPAAFAAKLVHPDRTVVAIVGDGCFAMTAGELTVARRLNLNVPVIVLNDGWLSLIKVKQERQTLERHGVFLGEPPASPEHYFGVPVRSARDASQFAAALDRALVQSGPTVIEAFIDASVYSQTVYD
jgi:acetolactate synthase-1/2/3 large subunit